MTESINPTNNTNVSQADYMKLFMQELTYQDPLKPIDNREFMAQMAQFSALQATQETNQYLDMLTGMMSANQSLMMLGKTVKIEGSEEEGLVKQIKIEPNAPPKLVIDINGSFVDKQLNEITGVRS